jgi:hypothetical protein
MGHVDLTLLECYKSLLLSRSKLNPPDRLVKRSARYIVFVDFRPTYLVWGFKDGMCIRRVRQADWRPGSKQPTNVIFSMYSFGLSIQDTKSNWSRSAPSWSSGSSPTTQERGRVSSCMTMTNLIQVDRQLPHYYQLPNVWSTRVATFIS